MYRKNQNGGEFIRLWRPSGVAGIELYSARLLWHSYAKHFHDEYTIGINDAGVGSFWCRGANQTAVPKSLNLLAPGEVHTGAPARSDGWTYRNIYVAPSLVEALARHLEWPPGSLPSFRQSIATDDCVWCAMDRLFRVLDARPSRLESDTSLLTALRLLFERFGDRQPPVYRVTKPVPAVTKARQYLEDRYRENIALDELASTAGVSPHYLLRCFRKQLGLPPHAYQLQLRLRSAKRELKSDALLADVALKHGFFDQSHFHHHFKRAFGITPGQYRKGHFVQDEGRRLE